MSDALGSLATTAAERFGDAVTGGTHRGELTLRVAPERLLELLAWLRDGAEPRFALLTDISGVDGMGLGWTPRFRVSYHLLAPATGTRLRVQADAPEAADGVPELPTATGLWELADWNEREVWDLMGIRFAGHPDLRRILLHEDYELGHPLQKQVPTRGVNDDNQ
jgi:NADH:ubiquinone oxidoreductase subunit C